MSRHYERRPGFGTKLKTAAYYATVNRTITTLRETASLNTIAAALNQQGLTTPRNLSWSKIRLGNYLRTSFND